MPTAPVAPTTATRYWLMRRTSALLWYIKANSPNGCSGRIVSAPCRSKAVCSALTAVSTSSTGTTQEIRIGEVEIISMLMLLAPRTVKTFAATPGWDFIPAPTIDTLPIASSVSTSIPSSVGDRLQRGARRRGVLLRNRERQLGQRARGARVVLDDHVDVDVGVGQRRRDAPRDAGRVGQADQRHARLAARVGDGGDEGVLHVLVLGLFVGDDEGPVGVVEA